MRPTETTSTRGRPSRRPAVELSGWTETSSKSCTSTEKPSSSSGGAGERRTATRASCSAAPMGRLITAISADAEIGAALGIELGEACLSLERWTWRGKERITYARQIYPGARYGLVAHFRA